MSKKISIGIWGASSTYGVGDLVIGGWVNRFRLYCDNKQADYYHIFNLGISGSPTKNIIDRFDIEAEARQPETIIFAIGANDSAYLLDEKRTRVPLEEYKNNIKKLISKAKKYSDNIIFVGSQVVDEERTDPLPWNPKKSFLNKYITEYEEALQNICKENKLDYINVQEAFYRKKDYRVLLFKDGLHPNEKGHQLICDLVKNKLGL